MSFSGKIIKCIQCNNEISLSSIFSHYRKMHSNLSDIELSKLHYLNNPKFDKFGTEFINYIFEHGIISSFKECYNLITNSSRPFNSFIKTLSTYREPTKEDIDTYFNFYLPYKKEHPKAVNSMELAMAFCRNDENIAKDFYEKVFKPKNAYTGHGGELSPWSKDFVSYKNKTDEEKNKLRRQKCYCRDREDFDELAKNCNTSLQFYLSKGYDEETAKKMLSERQHTFSLEKCIEKYGEEEGIKRFKERQKKWLSNLNKVSYSKISQKLFWKIFNEVKLDCVFATNDHGKEDTTHIHEHKVEIAKSYVKLDFYIPSLNKWIEFDGDYWHGEARGNQARDKAREEAIFAAVPGIQLKRVSERDYKANPEDVVAECVEWILEK